MAGRNGTTGGREIKPRGIEKNSSPRLENKFAGNPPRGGGKRGTK